MLSECMNRVSACVRLHAYLCTRTLQVAVSVRASLPPPFVPPVCVFERRDEAICTALWRHWAPSSLLHFLLAL